MSMVVDMCRILKIATGVTKKKKLFFAATQISKTKAVVSLPNYRSLPLQSHVSHSN
jgi:hypothetical protein